MTVKSKNAPLDAADLKKLISAEGGVISASIYSDPDIYQLELERIFARSWILLCPESQIPTYGDYFISYMGEDPVIVVRQKDGSVAAFLNQCRHRGGSLCRGESGNARAFTCSYHGWSYDTTGRLTSVPMEEAIYRQPLDKARWSARRVPRIEIRAGLVFGCWDETVANLETWLGESGLYFDLNFHRTDAGMEAYGGVYKWRIKANWKLAAEQFSSDSYHFFTTHASALMALSPPDTAVPDYIMGRAVSNSGGHGVGFLTDPGMIAGILSLASGPEFVQYILEDEQPKAIARHGETFGSAYPVFANFFPSTGYLHSNRTLRTWIPRGPDEVEVWAWTTIEKDAPPHIRKQRLKTTAQAFGPTGIFEQDDTANWVDVQRPLRGTIARQTEFNVQMGGSQEFEGWPGKSDVDISEAGSRAFYSRWLEMISRAPAVREEADV
jgi:3-phenylpropionate/trans-cinnamate dioxygenase alpha subunit